MKGGAVVGLVDKTRVGSQEVRPTKLVEKVVESGWKQQQSWELEADEWPTRPQRSAGKAVGG